MKDTKIRVPSGACALPEFDSSEGDISNNDGRMKIIKIQHPDPSSSLVYEELVPADTRPRDFLIEPGKAVGYPEGGDYLVIRQIGSVYAFVGRAVHIGPPEKIRAFRDRRRALPF